MSLEYEKDWKICSYCGEKFFRQYQNDFAWNIKRFCNAICADDNRKIKGKNESNNKVV